MSAIIVAGNEIIPDTLTVTVDGTEITAKDFQKVLLNINQASATASVADGTDLMQKMEIINKNVNACDVSFKGEGGATVKNLKQNQSMRLSWTGSYWYVTFGGLLSGVANDGTPFNYTTEVALDEAPLNTTYSTTEVDTGMTWIDGKKIYRRSWDISSLSTNASGSRTEVYYTLDNVSDIADLTNSYGWVYFSWGGQARKVALGGFNMGTNLATCYYFTLQDIAGYFQAVFSYNNTVSSASVSRMTLTLEYTKTTD